MTMWKCKLRVFGKRMLGLVWKLRPWITVCSNCQQWRPKECNDEAAWTDPYKLPPPRTKKVSHGLCYVCHDKLYPELAKKSSGSVAA